MSNLSEVPIFYKEQDESWATPARVVSRDEARDMKIAKLGVFINHGRAFRLFASAPANEREFRPCPLATRASDFTTDSAISFSEMCANVGIVEDHVRHPQSVIEKAQEKIKAYCSLAVADQNSPLPRGSWLNSESIQILVEA